MKKNYHKLMLEELNTLNKLQKPKLLLHSCCAPCSTYVLQLLSEYFEIEIFYFNPNIYPVDEYQKRMEEQISLVKQMGLAYHVIQNDHDSHLFYEAINGLEQLGEGSMRCEKCYYLRLEKTAEYAACNGFDYFTTTLTISPMKNVDLLNEIGTVLENRYNVKYLYSDFKKNNGYQCSVKLSREYDLYRQDYCGCVFSKMESEAKRS